MTTTGTRPFSRRRLLKLTAGTVAGLAMRSTELVAAQDPRLFIPFGDDGSLRSRLFHDSTTGRPVLPIYNLGSSDNRTFSQIVSDGGFLAAPVPMVRLVLAPAERAEILVDLRADEGRTLGLRSFNGANGTTFVPRPLQDRWDTSDFDLLDLRIGSATPDAVRTMPGA